VNESADIELEQAHADGGGTCRLTGELVFATVPELAPRLPELFTGGGHLTVDLAGVSRADSAALVLLLEMRRLAGEGGAALSLCNVPVSLRNIIAMSELDPLLPASG